MLGLVSKSVTLLTNVYPTAQAFFIIDFAAINLMSEVKPKASIDVIGVNNTKDQSSKYSQISLTFLAKVLQHELKHKLLWLSEPVNME